MALVLSAAFSGGRAASSQVPEPAASLPQAAMFEVSPVTLALELGRAIAVLKQGLAENWSARNQFLVAFDETPNTDSNGLSVAREKDYVACWLGARLREHELWDEGPPIEVEVDRVIAEFTSRQSEAEQVIASSSPEEKPAAFKLEPCSVHQKVTLSAGVAEGMLKMRVDPVYPADVDASGTVVLAAMISSEGRIESLRVISGQPMLTQAALEAVRQWIYRPYLLNGVPVEVETTVNVTFAPRH